MKKKVIIIGSTGMVGKGVLLQCLERDDIKQILALNRRSLKITHPKLKEIIHKDFSNLGAMAKDLKGYDACFFCVGVSSVGLKEEEYYEITHNLTERFADILLRHNSNLTFIYVSASGADSSEKGNIMWARVRGKTENMILRKGFNNAYLFRPALIIPEKGVKSKTRWVNSLYIILKPFYSLLKRLSSVTSTSKIGEAMINLVFHPTDEKILENKDINNIANYSNNNIKPKGK